MKSLTNRNQLKRYNNIIQDQIKEGIVEKVDKVCEQEIAEEQKVLSFQYRPAIREPAQTTKL